MPAPATGTETAGPVAFAAALLLLGVIWFSFPKAGAWLGLALVFGALFAANEEANRRGKPGPFSDLKTAFGR